MTTSADSTALNTAPAYELIRRIKEKGPVTFAEFMDCALYWGEGGYYTSGLKRWGPGGDYITSIDVSPVFSRSIAAQLVEMWRLLGSPGAFDLVEAGAGRGLLSRGILSALEETCPELYEAIRVRLVEKNPSLREGGAGEKTSWYGDITELAPITKGVVLSNELIDSLPVHRVLCSGGLSEIYVDFDGTRFVEVAGPLSTQRLSGYLEDLAISLVEGQRAEINLAAAEWMEKVAALLGSGFVVTIDYGLPARELYSPERRDGTLLCHYRHTINDNPYMNVGSQDITTHVDFTSLARSGAKAGLELTGFTTQKNFLLGAGVLGELRASGDLGLENLENIQYNRAVSELIRPGGMGDTFKVLVQHKGIQRPAALKGFSFREMSSYLL
ncbi:MAG TPA: SAM-dependent methyltransferase [Thermodesulfobacteriota bacterium]|nr:SAM-dependent methyltransferase [Thermodesulfobacteriota bacterium]